MQRRKAMAVMLCALWAATSRGAASPFRIGLISVEPPEDLVAGQPHPFALSLRRHGLAEGRDFVFEIRYTHGAYEKSASFVKEMIDLKVDLIASQSTRVIQAAKKLTSTIPIVFMNLPDPVAVGVVTSISHPGGNITGTSAGSDMFNSKQFELLTLIVPGLRHVALLVNANNNLVDMEQVFKPAAAHFGLQLHTYLVGKVEQIEPTFSAMRAARMQAVLVVQDAFMYKHASEIGKSAVRSGIPGISRDRKFAESGLLFSFGEDADASLDSAVDQIAKIVRGAKPGDLPVQQPVKFSLFINRRTATKLGLKLSQDLLLRADEVLE